MSRPTLSVVVVTQDRAALLPRFLANVAPVADEIVAVDGGSKDATADVLQAHPKVRYARRDFDTFPRQKNHAISLATSDWVLVLDSDELLSAELRQALPNLLHACRKRWYKLPRYWLVSLDPPRYVHADALYPDHQLRLFRNAPFWRYEEQRVPLHERFPRDGRGPGKKLRRGHILHLDFMLNDRATREAKVARYEQVWPGHSANRAYLWEDLPHEMRACAEGLPDDPA
ncbi:MAG: glycosyltransferase family 2 protein [Planctomycetes bacterium]|nr:glycosyltransferase family 2 protein [Planctomycetota bacterium]